MTSIRQSNRVSKSRDYWNLTNNFSYWKHSSTFIIYIESFEHSTENLTEDLTEDLTENLSFKLDEDLSSELDEDLSSELDKNLSSELDKDLSLELDKDLSLELNEDLNEQLSRQLHEDLNVDSSYQLQFLFKNKADKFQNLFKDSDSLKLFQLFFSVKEIEKIVKQINQQAVYINFKCFWKSLTVTEIYHYLECLVYMRIQSLQELNDY